MKEALLDIAGICSLTLPILETLTKSIGSEIVEGRNDEKKPWPDRLFFLVCMGTVKRRIPGLYVLGQGLEAGMREKVMAGRSQLKGEPMTSRQGKTNVPKGVNCATPPLLTSTQTLDLGSPVFHDGTMLS